MLLGILGAAVSVACSLASLGHFRRRRRGSKRSLGHFRRAPPPLLPPTSAERAPARARSGAGACRRRGWHREARSTVAPPQRPVAPPQRPVPPPQRPVPPPQRPVPPVAPRLHSGLPVGGWGWGGWGSDAQERYHNYMMVSVMTLARAGPTTGRMEPSWRGAGSGGGPVVWVGSLAHKGGGAGWWWWRPGRRARRALGAVKGGGPWRRARTRMRMRGGPQSWRSSTLSSARATQRPAARRIWRPSGCAAHEWRGL